MWYGIDRSGIGQCWAACLVCNCGQRVVLCSEVGSSVSSFLQGHQAWANWFLLTQLTKLILISQRFIEDKWDTLAQGTWMAVAAGQHMLLTPWEAIQDWTWVSKGWAQQDRGHGESLPSSCGNLTPSFLEALPHQATSVFSQVRCICWGAQTLAFTNPEGMLPSGIHYNRLPCSRFHAVEDMAWRSPRAVCLRWQIFIKPWSWAKGRLCVARGPERPSLLGVYE